MRQLHAVFKQIGIKRDVTAIYKWNYSKPLGTGGMIPTNAWRDVMLAARHAGILITTEDMIPGRLK